MPLIVLEPKFNHHSDYPGKNPEIGIWFIKLHSLLLVIFLNQIPILQYYFIQIQKVTDAVSYTCMDHLITKGS